MSRSRGPRTRHQPMPEGPREQGILVSVRDAFGFVECVERKERLFFHFSELRNGSPRDLQTGDELEFSIEENRKSRNPNQNLNVINAKSIPRGTVSYDNLSEERVSGVVEYELGKIPPRALRRLVPEYGRNHHFQRDRGDIPLDPSWNQDSGALRIVTPSSPSPEPSSSTASPDSSPSPLIPFYDYDGQLHNARVGDTVSYQVSTDKRTGWKRAKNIKIESKAPVERGTGFVCSLKNGFAFIDCCEVRRELFFHFSNLHASNRDTDLFIGAEVEYIVRKDARSEKLCAYDVHVLPEGTVSFEREFARDVEGVVVKAPSQPKPSDMRSGVDRRLPSNGRIQISSSVLRACMVSEGLEGDGEGDEEMEKEKEKVDELPFSWWDCDRRLCGVLVGDRFKCNIIQDKISKKLKVSELRMISMAPEARLQGVVVSAREDDRGNGAIGYIACNTMSEPLMFFQHDALPELEKEGEKENDSFFNVGDELEFVVMLNVNVNDKQTNLPNRSRDRERDRGFATNIDRYHRATRLSRLPKNTVTFDDAVEESVRGVVIREGGGVDRRARESREGMGMSIGLGGDAQSVGPVRLNSRDTGLIHIEYVKGEEKEKETDGVFTANEIPFMPIDVNTVAASEGEGEGEGSEELTLPLRVNDIVQFNISKSKQDGQIRATSITLLERPKEERFKGIVVSWKGEFGFIDWIDYENQIFFHRSDITHTHTLTHEKEREISDISVGTCVEFAAFEDKKRGRKNAVRVVFLPPGSVCFDVVSDTVRRGFVLNAPYGTGRDGTIQIDLEGEGEGESEGDSEKVKEERSWRREEKEEEEEEDDLDTRFLLWQKKKEKEKEKEKEKRRQMRDRERVRDYIKFRETDIIRDTDTHTDTHSEGEGEAKAKVPTTTRPTLNIGDSVEFNILTDCRTGANTRRAVGVRRVPDKGVVVVSCDSEGEGEGEGVVEEEKEKLLAIYPLCKHRRMPEIRIKTSNSISDGQGHGQDKANKGEGEGNDIDPLQVGDCVSFFVVSSNSNRRDYYAEDVKKIAIDTLTLSTAEVESIVRKHKERLELKAKMKMKHDTSNSSNSKGDFSALRSLVAASQYQSGISRGGGAGGGVVSVRAHRVAKGPDGTIGFSLGRGRAI